VNILINLLLVLDMLVALLMILVILMQRPKSEGLGAAFGGGVTENIFGAQTTNVLTKFTGWLAGIFFLLTFLLGVFYAQRGMGGDSAFRRELLRSQVSPAPVATAAPAAVTKTTPGAAPAASPTATVTAADLAAGAVPVPPVVASPSATPTPPVPQSP